MPNHQVPFEAIARLPAPNDNVAIVIQQLEAGTTILFEDTTLTLSHGILVGHRFAVRPIAIGEYLTSWGLPFGTAIQPIQAGDYVCNAAMINSLGHRTLDVTLPTEPNFNDDVPPFEFDATHFSPDQALPLYADTRTFLGIPRSAGRGVGTRNFIILLGTTSLTAGFVRVLENQLKPLLADYPNIDGIVAVAHTEGEHRQQNNRDLLLRTLAGFMVHPNVGAVLAVDYGTETLTNRDLRQFMEDNAYPLEHLPHAFMSLADAFEQSRDIATAKVKNWLDEVNTAERVPTPLSALKIALQCGGSDAFSGVSGNPLAAWVAREVIRYGGSANLAETDELVSAESYVLDKVRDVETAQRFLSTLDRFKTRVGWHGHSVGGNPSGGNLLRGLYNIYLKSLGAAAKKDPLTRLDYVIEYGERMHEGGFYFMDSPGNDLESVAGQVAAGCNLIFFVTGNGSITNFPFVPTIKIVTTTPRYELLSNEMDVNAGAYLDGMPFDELGENLLNLTIEIASGKRSVGEEAGHSQVQIWRNWQQVGQVQLESIRSPRLDGTPLPIPPTPSAAKSNPQLEIPVYKTPKGTATQRIALILPTSLCSGQIARLAVEQLNTEGLGQGVGVSRFATLTHTEGCGFSGTTEFIDTLLGYLTHPMIAHCLLLEHGCEITHNGYIKTAMRNANLDPDDYGWASIQLDGGIQAVEKKMQAWFAEQFSLETMPPLEIAGLECVSLGLLTTGTLSDEEAYTLVSFVQQIVSAGGTVVIPSTDHLLETTAFRVDLMDHTRIRPTLNYAQHAPLAGLHIMETPSNNWGETLTGLGATGVNIMLAYTQNAPLQTHPLVPVLYATPNSRYQLDADILLEGDPHTQLNQIFEQIESVLSRQYTPRLMNLGNVDFQITRGVLGVSL